MNIGIEFNCLNKENLEKQKELIKKLKENGKKIIVVLSSKSFEKGFKYEATNEVLTTLMKEWLLENNVSYDQVIISLESSRELCVNHHINYLVSDVFNEETVESILKLTGYPSIDKPWLKYYKEDVKNSKLPEMTIYELFKSQCEHYGNKTAIVYYGKKIKYSELLLEIDVIEQRFRELGIKKGDVVSICLPSTPEFVTSFYALNKIGAVINNFDPRTNVDRIKNFIINSNSKYLIMIDLAYPKIKKIEEEIKVDKIISVSATDSLPYGIKCIAELKQLFVSKKDSIPKNDKIINWDQLKKGLFSHKNEMVIDEKRKNANDSATIVYTGGTTGCPKGVVLSDNNVNSVPLQYLETPLDFNQELKFLNIMPPFIAYGLVFGIHLPLCLGMELILIPKFEPRNFAKLINKYKPSYFMGVPTHYENIISSRILRKADLSFVISAGAGGDSMNIELEKRINAFFAEHNCYNRVTKGYGMTEVASVATACLANFCNDIGSVGIPLPKNNVSIFDFETGQELKYNEKGEVCIESPQTMMEYYENESETVKVIKEHEDGSKWVHSKDIGYLTQEGKLYIDGRIKRMIIRPDGHNIFPFELENIIKTHYAVKDCVVVGQKSLENIQGEYPKAFIILKDEFAEFSSEIETKLKSLCANSLPERDVPYFYTFIKEFPLTPVGKIDFKALESYEELSLTKTSTKKLIFSNN